MVRSGRGFDQSMLLPERGYGHVPVFEHLGEAAEYILSKVGSN
jgi:hypothetical protein